MKWSKEKDEELRALVKSGKRHDEIAKLLNTTYKSINNRCFRLGIKTIYKEEIVCKQCGNIFHSYIKVKSSFCSQTCSGTFNSTGRILSEETKEKISKSLEGCKHSEESIQKRSGENNGKWIDGRSLNKRVKSINKLNDESIKLRCCKFCNQFKVEQKYKAICEDCRYNYYKAYRPSCEFRFTLSDYPGEFDFDLIKKHGWYKAKNRGNNLNGVSRDHLYSVKDGFTNKVDPAMISHPANCKLVVHTDNQKKNVKSEITLEELIERIKIWNLKYN